MLLHSLEIKTIWTEGGIEAVKICSDNPDIDLVLMDIKMPDMNGYEATKRIKKFRPELPIIAQTAYALYGDDIKAAEAGCDEYITKPVMKKELFELISKYLK
ncbi:MAG: response regulator [Bacteroidetes bacterium]|nr:response regulator [Bacteroidota bacterium]MCK4406900.1 response regulator [Bacteroidales bacterium]